MTAPIPGHANGPALMTSAEVGRPIGHCTLASKVRRPWQSAPVIGIDTHVLARDFVAEAAPDLTTQKQGEAARRLIESGQRLRVAKSLLLALEWLPRGRYGFAPADIISVFEYLLSRPQVEIEAQDQVVTAFKGFRDGHDFADALHHASDRDGTRMASFDDRCLARRAKRMGLIPSITVSN